MYQTDLKLQNAASTFNPFQAAELAMRGAEQIYDIHVSAARVLLQAQANTAAMFGMPDWSPLFDLATDQTRHILSAATEQVLDVAQRTNDVATELQRNTGHLIEAQTAQAADNLQRGMQEFSDQTNQNLGQLSRAAEDVSNALQDGQDLVEDTVQQLTRPEMPLNPISEAVHSVE